MTTITDRDIQTLSGYIYYNGKFRRPSDIKVLEHRSNSKNGFFAETYEKNGEIIIIYRGTDTDKGVFETAKDLTTDTAMWSRLNLIQLEDARKYYKEIAQKYKGRKIRLGGHSLGGSLAQAVAATEKGVDAVTFNAYGTGSIRGLKPLYPQNVRNYGNSSDAVFVQNFDNHIGKTYILDNAGHPQNGPKRLHNTNSASHKIENMGRKHANTKGLC